MTEETIEKIREEVRKHMAAKYKQDVEYWIEMYYTTMQKLAHKCNECYQLREENIKLKEQVDTMMKRDAEKADTREQLSPEMKTLLSQKVEELDLSVRTRNMLKANGIDTILDLCRLKKTDLLKFRNGCKKSLMELDDFLTDHKLTWGMYDKE